MSILCIVVMGIHVYPCDPDKNITWLSPNNTERYMLRLISDNVSPEKVLREYVGYMCHKHNLYKDDVRLHIVPNTEHLRTEIVPEEATCNAYIPTRLYFDAYNVEKNPDDLFAKIAFAIDVIHDMDTLIGRAKQCAVLKRKNHMHPNSDIMTNIGGYRKFLQEFNSGAFALQYSHAIPSDAYQKQRACRYEIPCGVNRQKADAEAFAVYETEVPALIAHHLKKIIYVVNQERSNAQELSYNNDALPLRQQYEIAYDRWKQNPQQETLYSYFNLDV